MNARSRLPSAFTSPSTISPGMSGTAVVRAEAARKGPTFLSAPTPSLALSLLPSLSSTKMLRACPLATTRSSVPSLFISPRTTSLGSDAMVRGEPGPATNNACCTSVWPTPPCPDVHEDITTTPTVASNLIAESVFLITHHSLILLIRQIQLLDERQRVFLPQCLRLGDVRS